MNLIERFLKIERFFVGFLFYKSVKPLKPGEYFNDSTDVLFNGCA